jgi:hypothetical protein
MRNTINFTDKEVRYLRHVLQEEVNAIDTLVTACRRASVEFPRQAIRRYAFIYPIYNKLNKIRGKVNG